MLHACIMYNVSTYIQTLPGAAQHLPSPSLIQHSSACPHLPLRNSRLLLTRAVTKQATSEQRAEEARQIITESLEQAFRRLAVQKPPPPDIDISGRLGEVLRRAEQLRASQADEYVVPPSLAPAQIYDANL